MTPLEIDHAPDAVVTPARSPDQPADRADRRARAVSRRTAIGAGVVGGAGLLAACSSDPPHTTTSSTLGPTTSDPATSGTTTTATSTTGTTGTTAASSSAVPDTTPPATTEAPPAAPPSAEPSPIAPPANAIARVDDIPLGGSLVIGDDEDAVALFRAADGSVVGHSAVCTHMRCTVTAEGPQLHCFCHQSLFDAATGAVLRDPAKEPLPPIGVAVQGDSVVRS